uniref:Uncharacterized protein n=1 Tax=Magallana gigas TaxID=29159 RepID=K1RH91_MAGGI
MAKEIWLHERVVVPVGAGICRRCSERHKTTYTTKVNIESDVASGSASGNPASGKMGKQDLVWAKQRLADINLPISLKYQDI